MELDPELARLRASIDNLDSALICLLAERFKVTQTVGLLKADHGLPAADPDREAQQIARLRRLADERSLSAAEVRGLGTEAAALLQDWLAAGWLHGD